MFCEMKNSRNLSQEQRQTKTHLLPIVSAMRGINFAPRSAAFPYELVTSSLITESWVKKDICLECQRNIFDDISRRSVWESNIWRFLTVH